ncbi:hypothetical protein ACIBQ1_18865 [Nonomuraea sp. NPDC050153]|uniref:hypothetical protein n=1 Tax=Nonomuraea sp. NPDC050153 TaxID=3364359 RepID=UPI0037AD90FF
MSQAWRRLARKTSALGLTGTLAIFVGSIFVVSTPTPALAAVTKQFSYTCTGSMLSSTGGTISVGLSAPDSVTAGTTFDLTVKVPELTLATAPTAATTLQVNATLTPTPGSIQDPGVKTGANVTTSATVPAKDVVYKVSVPTGSTGKVSVKPGQLVLSLLSPSTTTTTCTTTSTEVLDVTIGTGGGGGTDDVVAYDCDLASGGGDADYPADVDMKVVMTPPTSATANADATITWTGTIQSTGEQLKAPTGFPTTSPKMFVTIKASGAGAPSTATGEATLGTVTIGQNITLPTSVSIKVKPTTTGTVSLTAGDLAFGTSASSPTIKCLAPTTGLKAYTFQVSSASSSPSSTPTSSSPKPTKTSTATVTVTPSSKKSKTPKAGADTGAGGEAGPDGRMFILTGTALVGAAAVGGLVMRRRNATRG